MENNMSKNIKINIDLYDRDPEEDQNKPIKMSLTPCSSKVFDNEKFVPKSYQGKNSDFRKKWNHNKNKKFLNNKRKDKKFNSQFCETPHNTGQYLTHIHQELLGPKRKESKDIEDKEVNDQFNKRYNYDLLDFDDEFLDFVGENEFEDKLIQKRERLLSIDGKELENFLYTTTELDQYNKPKEKSHSEPIEIGIENYCNKTTNDLFD